MATKVSFDYEIQSTSGKVNRNGAAQISLQLETGGGSAIVNNTVDLGDLYEFQINEKLNVNEESNTEYYIKISGGARVLITRKYINFNK